MSRPWAQHGLAAAFIPRTHPIVQRSVAPLATLRVASTISQQLVKNLFLTTHRSIVRKAFEFTLVPIAEWILGKPRILELYLNVIEWGPGVYGVQEASDYHYGVPVAQLSRDQAARLAACISSPRIWKPARQDRYSGEILRRMENRGCEDAAKHPPAAGYFSSYRRGLCDRPLKGLSGRKAIRSARITMTDEPIPLARTGYPLIHDANPT